MRAVRPSVFVALIFAVAQACIPLIAQTLIDTIPVGDGPISVAVNPRTNKVYVVNQCGSGPGCNYSNGTVSVIDGATDLVTATVTVGSNPGQVAINQVTNKIYVTDSIQGGGNSTVTVIDGETNATTTVYVGVLPSGLAVNPITNKIYVSNYGSDSVTVVDGVTLSTTTIRPVNVPEPPAINTVTNKIYVANDTSPGTLTVIDGATNTQTTIPVGAFPTDAAVDELMNVIIDIDGYFATPSSSTLAFYPVPPCRVADTRSGYGPLQGPYLQGGQERDFPIFESYCGLPSTVQAYSLNLTVVPHPAGQPLSYLTVWPAEQQQPLVSTLNNLTGTIVANAAIVAAGQGGEGSVAVYPSDNTDLIIDVNGYFAPATGNGNSLYPSSPCRVLDTRTAGGAFSGELDPPIAMLAAPCGLSGAAQAYVLNATVVPAGQLGYLSLWPDGTVQPLVSTLNAPDGAITSNMAVVPNVDGSLDAYASGLTQLILDISSYFAP